MPFRPSFPESPSAQQRPRPPAHQAKFWGWGNFGKGTENCRKMLKVAKIPGISIRMGGKPKMHFTSPWELLSVRVSWDPFTLSNSPLCNKSLFVVLRHPKLDWYNICFIYLYNAYIDIDLWSSIYFFIFWQFIFRLHMKIIWLAKLCTWSRRVSSNIIRASNAEISLKWKQLTTNIWMFP